MLRIALRELRHHPGRYLAILIAVAISTGFLAAASVITATESQALTRQAGAPYTKADLVVQIMSFEFDDAAPPTGTQFASAVEATSPDISLAWPVSSLWAMLLSEQQNAMVQIFAVPPAAFSWTTVGSPAVQLSDFPLQSGEILLDARTATELDAQVGTVLNINGPGRSVTVTGITNEPSNRYAQGNAYVSLATYSAQFGDDIGPATVIVQFKPGADPATVTGSIKYGLQAAMVADGVSIANLQLTVTSATDAANDAGYNATGGVDVFKYFIWVFAGVALVVGIITIANTFAILLTQRRRQLGLLRAVGASGAQVRHSLWAEAAVLGLTGAVIGIGLAYALATAVAAYTGSIHFGLAVPGRDLIVELLVGVVITLLASFLPSRRATRIPVLDALRPPAADVARFRLPVVRTVICGLLVAAGVALCVYSLTGPSSVLILIIAVGGAVLTSFGVLFGAPLFIPGLLRVIGSGVAHAGVTAANAVKNVIRDPGRSSATATALMLAVGLIVTLQVGASSVQASAEAKIKQVYPVGFWVMMYDPETYAPMTIPEATQQQLADGAGVTDAIVLKCRPVSVTLETHVDYSTGWAGVVCAYDAGIAQIAPGTPESMPDDQVLVPPTSQFTDGADVGLEQPTSDHSPGTAAITLTATYSNLVRDADFLLVSPATMDAMASPDWPVVQSTMLFAVSDVGDAVTSINKTLVDAIFNSGGSAMLRQAIEQVLSILVGVITALLAIAMLIALVGVSSTLTLSVVERTRESALLRALGLKRAGLRLMLLIEALMLTLVGAMVGAVFGVFFGYVGAHAVTGQVLADTGTEMSLQLGINWPQTLGLLGVLMVAAALASVLPGRRAASASPVEALAET